MYLGFNLSVILQKKQKLSLDNLKEGANDQFRKVVSPFLNNKYIFKLSANQIMFLIKMNREYGRAAFRMRYFLFKE